MRKPFGHVFLVIDPEMLQSRNPDSEAMTGVRQLLLTNGGKVHLAIGGYDSDPRELYEIQTVRDWAAWFVQQVPVHQLFDAESLKIILTLLCDVRKGPGNRLQLNPQQAQMWLNVWGNPPIK